MSNCRLLRVKRLTKSFEDRQVLLGMDLEIGSGTIYGLLGSNGAGKTTAINIITGLLAPDGGTVELDDSSRNEDWRRNIGVAPQEVALYPRLSCAENIAFFSGLYGLIGRRRQIRVDAMIELAQLTDHRNVHASKLSGGTRRRLNLAIAMVHDPTLLILDEPTAGLDIESRYSLWSVIRTFRATGKGVLLTTHLLDEAAALCDRIAILHEGKIVREGTLEELIGSVPALQVAEIDSDEEDLLLARAAKLGFGVRRQGNRLALLLEEATSLESLIERLQGTAIRSISLRPVNLEDVFFEATGTMHRESKIDDR